MLCRVSDTVPSSSRGAASGERLMEAEPGAGLQQWLGGRRDLQDRSSAVPTASAFRHTRCEGTTPNLTLVSGAICFFLFLNAGIT